MFLQVSHARQPYGFAHAKDADHLPRQRSRVLEIVFCARGDFPEDNLLGGAPTGVHRAVWRSLWRGSPGGSRR